MASRQMVSKDPSDSVEGNAETSNIGNQASLPESKWIEVYVNGDEHFAGVKCMINKRYLRNFGAFLTYITERLQPSFGAVRNVYSPIHGSRITSLDQLQPNHGYVAAGSERFRKVENGYAQIRFKGKKTVRKTTSKVRPTNRRIRKSSGRLTKSVGDVITIHVYRNGDDITPPAKFVFTKRELLNWEGIMTAIGEKVQLTSGFVKKLYSLDGEIIAGADDLSNRRTYVAVGRSEYFKPKNYREIMQRLTIPSQSSVTRQKSQPLSAKLDAKANKVAVKVSSGRVREGTPIKKPKDHQMKGDFNINETQANLKPDSTSLEKYMFGSDESVFKPQQQKPMKTVEEVNLDQDHGGLFRASEEYDITKGANEVQETHDTAVELPIDQVEAEEIDDEITPEMERAMQDLDLNSSQLVAYLPSLPKKTSVTPTKQLLRTNGSIQPHYQNTFA